MASSLARKFLAPSGQSLRIFNRDPAKLQPLLSDESLRCVAITSGLAEMTDTCDVIFMMLSHDGAVLEVVGQLLDALRPSPGAGGSREEPASGPRPPRVIVDCSTVSPDTTKEMASAAEAAGAQYVACPVLGR
ncbi:hypothetical protein GPECTOR_58g560 [Gonium pectorale]|uniref:6-phosphogluconate dehydrogenase NADP-binding domain-containing protein n=1 Tax=Gonium pectorale TaxID=33097 RepID=A0A150G5K6_GONPE|nr:hypothetical protein GPECTOR_58g560 [Gonium pectorale]|eukprot:KXZ45111.1 hypothetical protein GPECTOR_58g560 [Gonium pectorale]